MTEPTSRSFIIERVMPHPATKIWRALTQTQLMDEWLMKNDFEPVIGHKFNFRAPPISGWNGITDCEVLAIEQFEKLAYTWNNSGEQAKNGLKTTVTWTLTPIEGGTLVRMEQSGFRPEETRARGGARGGWQQILEKLEKVLITLE